MVELGIVTYSYLTAWKPHDTLEFLEHCHGLGAAGIQAPIHGNPALIRERAEKYGMFLEAVVPLPSGEDTSRFEESLQEAGAAGATALRSACLDTRRYETFADWDSWRLHVQRSREALAAAVPLLEKYKLPLGLENHKDWTSEELLKLVQHHSSQYLGICLDFGNNIALLEEPMEVIEKLAPWVITTHFKNMAVEPCDDGFLLSEVPLGDGYLDLPRALATVKAARPQAHLSLESITRDPLHVPCLTNKYWATFPERPGIDLARTLQFVQQHKSGKALPRVSHLSRAELLALENQNVVDCLEYFRNHLSGVLPEPPLY